MKSPIASTLILAALALRGFAQPAEPDPNGVLLKPIPDKLIVLTFDDACASGCTVAAPILKSLGFGGTFYVCDFDSFKTRKDWYMTYRQMQAMAADGFEIGNHSVGHHGGLQPFLAMDEQLQAHHVPKTTTVCWPLYQADAAGFPELTKNGYTFGRGGHDRPYRPSVDNPFDVPSFTLRDGVPVETFIKQARQACQGRVVVFTLHGVPDMEHGEVGLEPATFKVMMQYLKDNQYQVIAMRDLTKYIDAAKAAKLPPTAMAASVPELLVKDDTAYVAPANVLKAFNFPDQPPGRIIATTISVTVPYAADLTHLTPNITVSPDASIDPASGTTRDFTKPQTYSVTGKDGSKQTYTVTVIKAAVGKGKDVLTFALPGPIPGRISGTRISLYVPQNTDVKALAPTITLSPFATAAPASGTPLDFTQPQSYTITAQDGSKQVYAVTVIKSSQPNAFTWGKAESGNWSDGSKWSNNLSNGSAPLATGRPDYDLTFDVGGNAAVTNDLPEGFQLNQINLGEKFGVNVAGKRVSLVTNNATGALPQINVNTAAEGNPFALPMELAADTAVNVRLRGRIFVSGVISGKGGLTFNCPGSTNFYQNWGILRIQHTINTYSGGTIINGGQLFLLGAEHGLGTGPVTLNDGADIRLESAAITNPLTINGGTIESGSWDAPITLNGNAMFAGPMCLNQAGGGISGPGGITQIGPIGPFSRLNAGELSLWGTNTYTGPTIIEKGTLIIKKAVALYNAEPANWSAAKITVHPATTLYLPTGGPGELTGAQVGTLLTKLTTAVNHNGLMAGATFCVDTSKATATVILAPNISDSQGPGGGAFILRKCQPGTLQLAGTNTYTGQTILEGGTLSVASLNSVVKGKPSSSLGAPKDIEAGEIVIGKEMTDGDCALVYTGKGETSDRVMNLAGKTSTVTFDQSGSGLLKLTSDLLISGYGANKTIALTGDTTGSGEFAGAITNPHDRTGKAITSLTKSGKGTWTLSGSNSYSGPTKIAGGTLVLTSARTLADKSEIDIAQGAVLELNFKGEKHVSKLTLGGQPQAPGKYSATHASGLLKGSGVLVME